MASFFKHAPHWKETKSRDSGDEHEEQSLTTLLDESQRADLIVLISQISESMRKVVFDNFEISHHSATESPNSDVQEASESPADPQPTHDKHHQSGFGRPGLDPKSEEALIYFDDWRDSVLLRVGEVVNKHDGTTKQDSRASKSNQQPQDLPDPSEEAVSQIQERYSSVETSLGQLPRAHKLVVLHALLLLLLSLKHYSAHSRVLLLHVTSSLGLSLKDLNDDEAKVARGLLNAAVMSADEETKKKADDNRNTRKWKVGFATVAGAALIGVTGGLAAPLVAAGLGTIMGGLGLGGTIAAGYLGALASSGVVVGGLFGAYGGKMTGQMMDRYAREVEDFAFIPTHGVSRDFKVEKDAAKQDHRLRVTIGITGWATEEDDMVVPWRVIRPDSEVFALRWEYEALLNLGNSIRALVTAGVWMIAKSQILSRTILAGIMSAVMLPVGLVKLARIAANPFSVAISRADKAGEVLADALINKAQGERPVTLIGYSLGSRVIYSCLRSLSRRRAYGLIETAILMGSPVPADSNDWQIMRSVVSGRLVNIFSENDAVLALLYRATSVQVGIAGLEPIKHVSSVENVDLSETIDGHLRYQFLLGKILQDIGFEEIDDAELRKEQSAMLAQDEAIERERAENERKREKKRPLQANKPTSNDESDGEEEQKDMNYITLIDEEEEKEMEQEVNQRTRDQMMHRKMKNLDLYASKKDNGVRH